ncbi:hypothetical protein SLE2022_097670 [Rubroshorea leprosula]
MDSSLFLAVSDGKVDTLLNLLQIDPLILERAATSSTADSPLHISAMLGHLGVVKELLKHKRDVLRYVKELNQYGFSSIHMASANGHVEVVRELLKISRELCSLKGNDGMTALHCAAVKGRVEVINLILQSYPETVTDLTATRETALHLAVKNNQVEALEMLIKLVKDYHLDLVEIINSMDEEGNTVLHLAASRKNRSAIELLLNCNNPTPGVLEVNAVNKSGLTPLDVFLLCSCESMYSDMERLFMNSGAGRSCNIDSKFRIAAAATAPNPTPNTTVLAGDVNGSVPNREDIIHWEEYFKFQMEKSDPDKVRSDLLVVAVLMATATYQAMFSPPDAVKDRQNNRYGYIFPYYAIFNTIGFYMSLYIILILTNSHPMYWELVVASAAMFATYGCALASITPQGHNGLVVRIVCFLVPFLILYAVPKFRKWYKKRRRIGLTHQSDHVQNA